MFNFTLLLAILSIQLLPSVVIDYLVGDLQWELWHISMLVIILLQAIYIYKEQRFDKLYTKIISGIILVVSLWFLFTYTTVTSLEKYSKQEVTFKE